MEVSKIKLKDFELWDIPLNQVPHFTVNRVNQEMQQNNLYSYKKQLKRIYKFFDHNPSPEAKVVIERIKSKIRELNQFSCGECEPEKMC